MQYIHVCAFMGMQSVRIGLILVLEEGCIPLYLVKEPFGGAVIKQFCTILFQHFCLKMQNSVSKKKKRWPLFSDILGRSVKGKQTFIFLGLI